MLNLFAVLASTLLNILYNYFDDSTKFRICI